MANNRMYLYHPGANAAVFLGDCWDYEYRSAPRNLADRIERLFELAAKSNPEYVDTSFKVLYETDDQPEGMTIIMPDSG